MRGRTVILVSHHVQLCAPGAEYVVALEKGRVQFEGDNDSFQMSGVKDSLVQSGQDDDKDDKEEALVAVEDLGQDTYSPTSSDAEPNSEASSVAATTVVSEGKPEQKKAPRKLVEEEKRAVGRISGDIWKTYVWACGGVWYWVAFLAILVLAAMSPVAENKWLE